VKAPPFTLPSTVGGEVSLSDYIGKKNVLLYFQEGIMCKACWDQLEDIQKVYYKFKPLDIEVVTITVDPINANIKESNKRGITLPVLDDANLSVSKSYDVLDYSMHPGSRPGHSFVLIDKDGNIIWKKDYYPSPKQGEMMNGMNMNMAARMYVPVDELLREIYKVSYLLFPKFSSSSMSNGSYSNAVPPVPATIPNQQNDNQNNVNNLPSNKTMSMIDHSMCLTPIHQHADIKFYLNGDPLNLTQRKYMDQVADVHFHPTVKVNPTDIPGIPFADMLHLHQDNITIRHFLNTLDLDNQILKAFEGGSVVVYDVNGDIRSEGQDYIIHDKDRILVTNTPLENTAEIAKQITSVSSYAIIGIEKNPSLFGGC
ncbi:MAG: redoxin domain-containing protein, partial [Nitrososphaeraceae archaeon]